MGWIFRIIFFPYFLLRRIFFGKHESRQGIPLMVLEDYTLNLSGKGKEGALLWATGRGAGWPSFILDKFGWAPRSEVRVNKKDVRFTYRTRFTTSHLVVPLEDINTADCRFEKPAWRLYLGIFLLVFGLIIGIATLAGGALVTSTVIPFVARYLPFMQNCYYYGECDGYTPFITVGSFVIALIPSAILFFTYWRTKRIVITFSTGDIDNRAGIAFKRRLGLDMKYEDVIKTYKRINQHVIEAHYARFSNPLSGKAVAEMREASRG